MSEDISKEEEEIRRQFRKEIAEYNIFVEEYSPAKSRTDLLLFRINKNLKSIDDSLDLIVDHFELGG